MSLVDRAKNILVNPKTEWPRIDAETTTVKDLFVGYAAILILLPAIGALLGGTMLAGPYSGGTTIAIGTAIIAYVGGLAVLYVVSLAAAALAPSFDGQKDSIAAAKLVVFSGTPVWVASLLAQMLYPVNWGLGGLVMLAGYGYAAYQLYLGSMTVVKIPDDKAVGYTAVLIISWIVIGIVIGAILGMIIIGMFLGGAATGMPGY